MKKLLIMCTLSLAFIVSPLKASEHAKAAHKKGAVHKTHPHHKQGMHKPGEHHKGTGPRHHDAAREKAATTKHEGFLSGLLGGTTATTTDKVIGTTAHGKTIYLGPRGGHYYINDHGNKEYIIQEK